MSKCRLYNWCYTGHIMGYTSLDTRHSDISLLPSTVPVPPPGHTVTVAGSSQSVPRGDGRPATLDPGSRRLGGGADRPDSLTLLHQEVAPLPSNLIAELMDYSQPRMLYLPMLYKCTKYKIAISKIDQYERHHSPSY